MSDAEVLRKSLDQITKSNVVKYDDLLLVRKTDSNVDRATTKSALLESLKFLTSLSDEPDFLGQIGILDGVFYISVTRTGDTKWQSINNETSANFIQELAGESIDEMKVVAIISNRVYNASCLNMEHLNKIVGVNLFATNSDNFSIIQINSRITNTNWNWIEGKPINLGFNGELIQAVPDSGFLQTIGYPLSKKAMVVSIQKPIIL
jgi:hypothetical protein